MVVDKIKEIFQKDREVKFKMHSLEYIIKEENNRVLVYPLLYPQRKSVYCNLENALNYYIIYNESIIENQDRITILN